MLCDKTALWPTTEQTHNRAVQRLVLYEEKEKLSGRRNLKYKTIENIKNNRPRDRGKINHTGNPSLCLPLQL